MNDKEKLRYRLVLHNVADLVKSKKNDFSKTALGYLGEVKRFFTGVVTGLEPGLESARERTAEGYQALKQEGQRLFTGVVTGLESARERTAEGYRALKQEGQSLFTDAVTGLESARERTAEGYQSLKQGGQRLSKIVELAGYNSKNVIQRDAQTVVGELKAKRDQLSHLVQNPLAFYKRKDAKELLSTSKKIKNLHEI